MANTTDETRNENSLDDYQDIDVDISELYNKFILPIESLRSKSSPNIAAGIKKAQDSLDSNSTGNNKEPQESRVHTFYRILGLPVLGSSSFYNPGFDPKKTIDSKKNNDNVNSSITSSTKQLQAKRESDILKRYNIFKTAGTDAAVYSLALSVPNGQKPFSSKSVTASVPIEQDISIPQRDAFLNKNFTLLDSSNITNTFSKISHSLYPVSPDAVICFSVLPKSNQVCVPFPSAKEDRSLEKNVILKCCGLELILRLRLLQNLSSLQQSQTFQTINKDISSSAIGDLSSANVNQIAQALLNLDKTSSSDVNSALFYTREIELENLNNYVKTLKSLIHLYSDSIKSITEISQKIIWTPLCSTKGPEGGTDVVTGFIKPKVFLQSWDLELRLTRLKLKSQLAKQQADLGNSINFSDFATSEFQNVSNVYETELSQAEQNRKNLRGQASDALKTIEMISGEISGLGLIDILAIYMALWSVSIPTLLNLLDDASAYRLYQIESLRTQDVIDRYNNIGNDTFQKATESVLTITTNLSNVLSYADRLYAREKGVDYDSDGGNIPRSI